MNRKLIYIAAGIGITLAAFTTLVLKPKKLRQELELHIEKLHPIVQNKYRSFIFDIETNTPYKVQITSGYRGWADSVRIYNTYPQVQACCPPCHDYHCYGLALDMVLVGNGKYLGNNSSRQDWESTGIRQIARKYGFQWGIDFIGYFDPVHFALPMFPINELVARAIQQYGSLQNAQGNRLNVVGLNKRTWQIA
jgi:hypothetical protein